jgi:hypothetical protein
MDGLSKEHFHNNLSDTKISALEAASAAAGANEIPINEAGTTKKVTVTQIATAILPVKAAGSDITTGTDDAKFLTSKSLADATIGKFGAAWTSFNPTWGVISSGSNTLSNGTLTGYYIQIGKTVIARYYLLWGASTSSTGVDWSFTYPVAPISAITSTFATMGNGSIFDSGTANYAIVARGFTGTVIQPQVLNSTGSYLATAGVSYNIPQTWAVGDYLNFTITYEAT